MGPRRVAAEFFAVSKAFATEHGRFNEAAASRRGIQLVTERLSGTPQLQ